MHLDIPKDFNSDVDGKPFLYCKVCEHELNDGKTPYTIEKAFKRVGENEDVTLFEIAICMPCAEKQSAKMSKESRAYLMRVMGNSSFLERREQLWKNDWQKHWKNACIFTHEEVKLNEEYHIVGHFLNGQIIPHAVPFMIGNQFIEEIQENLSVETKEEMDKFGEQFLGPDPSIKALLKDYQFVMV